MGLLDKVKAQATQVAQKAQEAGKAGQAKLEEAQAKRKVDALLRDLGGEVYAQRTGRHPEDPAAIDALVEQVRALEADHGAEAVVTDPTAAADEAARGTSGGDFRLDDV